MASTINKSVCTISATCKLVYARGQRKTGTSVLREAARPRQAVLEWPCLLVELVPASILDSSSAAANFIPIPRPHAYSIQCELCLGRGELTEVLRGVIFGLPRMATTRRIKAASASNAAVETIRTGMPSLQLELA